MKHEPRTFELEGLKGISENQIAQHRDTLYAGYVNKLNEIEEKLRGVDLKASNQTFSELRELKVEESFALNGVVLHELYFENMCSGGKKLPSGGLSNLIARDFGSFESWQSEFSACGMAARGWVVLGFNLYDGKLHNYCFDSHNTNIPAHFIPILVMDVYEHAYMIDYGVKRPPYIEAFIGNINWPICQERFEQIPEAMIEKAAAS